jgi:hypothetical protein
LSISVSSSSSATVNSADSNALNTDGSLSQSKGDTHQVTGNYFQCLYSTATNFVELNWQDFCQPRHFNFVALFYFWLPTVLDFP